MKYIIKNCPAVYIFKNGYCCNNLEIGELEYFKDISDCALKQIVEKCKKITNVYCKSEHFNPRYQDAKEILNLLEIEEVDE